MLKKILIAIGVFFLVVIIAFGGIYLYYKPYTQDVMQKLEVSIDSLSIERTFDSPELVLAYIKLSAINYLPFTVGVDSLVLRGTYNDTLYVLGLDNRSVSIKKGDRVSFSMPVLVQYQRLIRLKQMADSLGGRELELQLMAYLDLPLVGKISFPINEDVEMEGGEAPDFSITNIAVNVGKDLERADVNIYTKIEGKLNREVVLDSLNYALEIEGKTLIWGHKSDTLYPKSDLVLPATLALNGLREKFREKSGEELTPVTISGAMQVSYAPILTNTPIAFHLQTMARLPIPPEITVDKVKLEDVTWREAGLVVVLKAINENPFGLTFNRLDYKLELNGDNWTETTITEGFRVGPHDTALIELPAEVGWIDLGETAFNYIIGKREVDYVFEADLDLVFDIEALNTVKLHIYHSGKADMKKMRKNQKDARRKAVKERKKIKGMTSRE